MAEIGGSGVEFSAIAGATLSKNNIAEDNQDAFFVAPDSAGVFDGVSQSTGARVASRTASRASQDRLNLIDTDKPSINAVTQIGQVLVNVDKIVSENENAGSTTALITKLFQLPDGTKHLGYGYLGDSRLMHIRSRDIRHSSLDQNLAIHEAQMDGNDPTEVQRLTSDHIKTSEFSQHEAELYEKYVLKRTCKNNGLQTISSNTNIITEFLGKTKSDRPKVPELGSIAVDSGDIILLLTDGVTDNLTDEQIKNIALGSVLRGFKLRFSKSRNKVAMDASVDLLMRSREVASLRANIIDTIKGKADDETAVFALV